MLFTNFYVISIMNHSCKNKWGRAYQKEAPPVFRKYTVTKLPPVTPKRGICPALVLVSLYVSQWKNANALRTHARG